jgi:hypothetical protein
VSAEEIEGWNPPDPRLEAFERVKRDKEKRLAREKAERESTERKLAEKDEAATVEMSKEGQGMRHDNEAQVDGGKVQ